MRFTGVITEADEGGYIARCAELSVTTDGETFEEAVANLRDAATAMVEVLREDGELPHAGTSIIVPFDIAV